MLVVDIINILLLYSIAILVAIATNDIVFPVSSSKLLTNVITDKLAESNVKAAMEDKVFMQKVIINLMQNWTDDQTMVISVENKEELEKHIQANAKALLDNKLKIESVNGVKTGFVIAPEDGSYKVKFGEEEFIEYFKEYLRPQIQKLLF